MDDLNSVYKKIIEIQQGDSKDKTSVTYSLFKFGRDYMLLIHGGDPHIGSVGCTDKKTDRQYHQFTLETHREDRIVEKAVKTLNRIIKDEVLVVCGIHYDQISLNEIQTINQNCEELLKQMAEFITNQL